VGKYIFNIFSSIAYLAPEMLKRTGHGKAVDWYLLGVLFYEMLVGIPPYFTNNKYYKILKIREQLFKNIEKAELQIPNFVSPDARNLLRSV
jgi:serine/threonine protein kinase